MANSGADASVAHLEAWVTLSETVVCEERALGAAYQGEYRSCRVIPGLHYESGQCNMTAFQIGRASVTERVMNYDLGVPPSILRFQICVYLRQVIVVYPELERDEYHRSAFINKGEGYGGRDTQKTCRRLIKHRGNHINLLLRKDSLMSLLHSLSSRHWPLEQAPLLPPLP